MQTPDVSLLLQVLCAIESAHATLLLLFLQRNDWCRQSAGLLLVPLLLLITYFFDPACDELSAMLVLQLMRILL